MSVERFDWTVSDVVEATGLDYYVIRRALLAGDLSGIVAPRLLRTNEQAVERWLETMRVKPQKAEPTVELPKRTKQRGKVPQAFRHVDPAKFGRKGR